MQQEIVEIKTIQLRVRVKHLPQNKQHANKLLTNIIWKYNYKD